MRKEVRNGNILLKTKEHTRVLSIRPGLSLKAPFFLDQSDTAEAWLYDYEAPDFRDQIQRLWEQLQPLYLQLHAYVRSRLRLKYGDDIVPRTGPIPAHLLGEPFAPR